MKLAVNWSPQAERLLLSGDIDVDLWKCSDWPELVDPALETKPAYVHFPIHTSKDFAVDWEKVRMWMDKTGTTNVNMHLIAAQADFPDIPFDSRDAEHRERVVDMMVRCIKATGDAVGIENVIVENLPTRRTNADGSRPLHCSVMAETIAAAIERSGCRLLLDIDHARNAADVLGMDAKDYIESLPVDRIGELHASGVQRIDGELEDHMGMSDECWGYFDWAIERMRSGAWATPGICAFEYGGIGPVFRDRSDIKILAEQVPRLFAAVHSLDK